MKDQCLDWFNSIGLFTGRVVVSAEEIEPVLLSDSLILAKTDSMVSWLTIGEYRHALPTNKVFAIDSVLQACESMKPDDWPQLNAWADSAYMRYAQMLHFGVINPETLDNHHFKVQHPDAAFAHQVHDALHGTESMAYMLSLYEPKSTDYKQLADLRNSLISDPEKSDEIGQIECNMERLRWRMIGQTNRHIVANVAEQMVRGFVGDSVVIECVTCVGRPNSRTPMLLSQIYEVELNPQWNVPNSIVMNEIAPRLLRGDSTYFRRNGMVISQGGKMLKANEVNWTDVRNKNQTIYISQGSGAGNALGRVKFKFANPFNVYLHDTNSPRAYQKEVRTVSHGCVRVSKPLDLAIFCLEGTDEYLNMPEDEKHIYVDCMRYSIGREPVSKEGKKFIAEALKNNDEKKIQKHGIKISPAVSVTLDYKTYTLDSLQHIQLIPDVYQLDSALYNQLQMHLQ